MKTSSFQASRDKPSHIKGPKQKKLPKKITERYLHNAGLYYLQRFAASSGHFKTVMTRKIDRSCHVHTDQSREECLELLHKLTEKFINVGLIDDQAYLRGMVISMRRKGLSRKAIVARLQNKKLARDDIEAELNAHDNDQPAEAEFIAALRHSRKKRLGPFSTKDTQKLSTEELHKTQQRALGSMARAGFSFQLSQEILGLSRDEAEYKLLSLS